MTRPPQRPPRGPAAPHDRAAAASPADASGSRGGGAPRAQSSGSRDGGVPRARSSGSRGGGVPRARSSGSRGGGARGASRGDAALELFAVCAPGLEPLLAAEVAALGLAGRVVPGGVELRGDLRTVARLNLWLRTATRVLVRLGAVRATTFAQLVHEAKSLRFEDVLAPGVAVALRASCRKSRLYHSDAVAERLHLALQDRLGRTVPRVDARADDDAAGTEAAAKSEQLLLARFDGDLCTVSADSSGALLHQRGWRTSLSKAPLRETLAAALVLAARYDPRAPFLDPLCGSGTLAIEAALIARRRAPGLGRAFALQRWPGFDAAAFARAIAEARAQELRGAPAPIFASDAEASAVAAARGNAARAGVQDDVRLAHRTLADLPAQPGPGLCATNPPYGVRVGAADGDVPGLWRALGQLTRARLPGFGLAVLCPDERLSSAAGLHWETLARTSNGGLPVELLRADPLRNQ